MQLDIILKKKTGKPLYIQLYSKIRELILDGTLKPHTKLPPIRKLADKLEINNVTVVNAYKLLQENNLVYKKVGSGTYIKDTNIFSSDYISSDSDDVKTIYNFASTTPDSDLFPVEDFKTVLNSILSRDKGNAFICSQSQGFESLRISIKKFLYKSKIFTDISNIQIVSGAQQGIDIISKALVNYGDIVFCESPTYAGAIAAFKSRGAKIIDINLENDGLDMRTLENNLMNFNPKFIYIMPNFQNPTGVSYSNEKKAQLLNLAKKYNTYIVEDDFARDVNYNSKAKALPIKSIDTDNRVIYIKSFSKTLMPGLRLGFIILPLEIYSDVITAKQTSDISTSGLIQRCLDLYLRKGLWEKHVLNMNNIYCNKYKIMIGALEKYMPKSIKYNIPNGGLGFWITMPEGFSSIKLNEICIRHGITIVPGYNFYVNRQDSNNFRLSIASIKEELIEKGIKKLAELIDDFIQKPSNQYTNNNFIYS
ncbi:PLP-dependent aminotransferase family protein [Clostridiaceae bacterium M8S5]|nr:PLP-dependent aminotransferase family protein [Clostridiaceae bacterium M8S5]